MEASLEIIVRSTEIDVNGHVNNAKYLEYLEWGREEWYEQANLPYDTFLELGIQTVTVNITINYRKECVQNDRLIITTKPERLGRTSYTLKQEIYNQRNELVADALVTSVTMDSSTRTSRPVPAELARLFAHLAS
ncbi:acyl-CoA thioesterase [Aneurinibacillus migulanus]|uniref:Thioesterase n=1 Tax=Aneurinibacillus migulanus TaxID=47500 RepID=A0A0D1W0D0_ANEMI|nr:acyl-CoA thioesterase [Aneurinibacillus migulanus]KIV51940.1 thioesterase [Aneurinibacillus migulanus]KON98061.1 thioesterase [Aneurinibacillus migulanus]MED0891330.1 acyl-CoA thioesterase [Aneurinibacillus migulanus]MED1613981.1 acyl-CoA thioesterase [Aneurinibacillus migulanus]SDI02969.1 thioesterase-3 [Aneurinibacillus migulanus]